MAGPQILDNTPTWLHDRTTGSGEGLGRCNPYGFERDPQVMGGTHDIGHEEFLYFCRNHADARYRVVCANGHTGEMTLCYGHAYNFRKRQAGLCPRCAWPTEARQLEADMNDVMRRMAGLAPWDSERAAMMSRLDTLRHAMDELRTVGKISTGAPLRLEEVS